MNIDNRLYQWISNNKQVGSVFSFKKGEDIVWSSIALQKWEGKFKVYIDEILESQMAADNYLKEDIVSFLLLEDALSYIQGNSKVDLKQLKPCKGQKIFNPEF